MKKISIVILVALAAVFFTSCLRSDYQSTPMIRAYELYRSSASGVQDTLQFGDTIGVGDTIYAPLILEGIYNNLVSFEVQGDKSAFDYRLECDSAYLPLLAQGTDMEKSVLRFTDNCYVFVVTLRYIAKQQGTYQFKCTLASTANEKYSPTQGYFTQSVR